MRYYWYKYRSVHYTSIKWSHSCGNPEATLYLLVTTFDDLHVNLDSLLLLKLGRLGLLLLTPGKVMKLETSFPASYAFLLLLLFYDYTWLRTPLNQHLTPLIQQESPSNNFRLGVKMLVGWRCTWPLRCYIEAILAKKQAAWSCSCRCHSCIEVQGCSPFRECGAMAMRDLMFTVQILLGSPQNPQTACLQQTK